MNRYTKYNMRHSKAGKAAIEIDRYTSRGLPSIMSERITRANTLKLVRENPELFNLNAFSPYEKAALLITGYAVFKKYFDPADFDRPIRFALFLTNTKRYEKYVDFNKLKGIDVELLFRRRPAYIQQVPVEIRKKFPYPVWRELLTRHFVEQAPIFMDNIANIRNKTELRELFRQHPKLFWMVMPEHIEEMVLSPKDFLLLANSKEMRVHKVKLRKVTVKAAEHKLMITVLDGTDKNSKQLGNALGAHK